MLKLLLCLSTAMLLAILTLHLRQQKLELNHDVNELHNAIEAQQSKLWNQQLQIAVVTAPNAIAQTVHSQQLKMVPRSPLPARTANWMDKELPDPE